MRICTLLCVLFLSETLCAAIPTPPSSPLFTALWRGDIAAVHRLEKQGGAGPIMQRLANVQLNYDIPRLLVAAQQCQKHAFKDRGKGGGYLPAALLCNYIVRSSALIQGNARLYLQQTQWAKDILFPALVKAFPHNGRPNFESGLDTADLREVTNRAPVVSNTWLKESTQLRYTNQARVQAAHDSPVIKIRVNGHATSAIVQVNGGLPLRTPIALIEPAHGADPLTTRLGLDLLVRNYGHVAVAFDSVSYQSKPSLFLADTIAVGPLVMHHVAVAVIRSDFIPPGVYLENSMWQRFGEVTVTDKSVRLSRRMSPDCSHPVPLRFVSDYPDAGYREFGQLVFSAQLNHASREAALTNQPKLVSVNSIAWKNRTRAAHDQDSASQRNAQAPVEIKVGNQTIDATSIAVKNGWRDPYQIALGLPILDTYTVQLRLSGGAPSVCFVRNTQKLAAGRGNDR